MSNSNSAPIRFRQNTRRIAAGILTIVFVSALQGEEIIQVGRFSAADLRGWKEKKFEGTTLYRLIRTSDKHVLEAEAHASASGLFRKIRIDLNKTPYLHWCWKIIEPLPPLPEETKAGDDYAARIYLVQKGGLAFWRTKALNYVWSSSHGREALWPNAFAGDNVMMLAVRNRNDQSWICEKRNVRSDWKRAFGEIPSHIDAVALMTDSDNSQQRTVAHYGDIWFTAD